MRRTTTLGALALAVALIGSAAETKPVKYAGVHPRTGQPDGGVCYIQFFHAHRFEPANASVLYRVHAGAFFFIGDPVPFGYDGPRHAYYGHHPVLVNAVLEDDAGADHIEYCYLDGPHFHSFAPPSGQRFVEKDGVHYYAGDYPPAYEQARSELSRVNAIYRALKYERPAVAGPPPEAYRGPISQTR
ncbi:MAG TPA: hypothetical protein VE618_06705 [Myxococcaceae bacterium]|nr:hypothetical protein [Myxococcaceae bacterium]